MESETINLTSLICETLNSIFFKIFSSVDTTVYSNLDNILFIHSDMVQDAKFQKLFGTNADNGLLLIANSLIFGIVLFYVFKFVISHLTYSKVDSPYQFMFKCIIFIACMNGSLWICEGIISLFSLISDSICELGNSITGCEINFTNLMNHINSALYPTLETFDIFSFEGILKLGCSLSIVYILFVFSVRYILCKILLLLSPFACMSLISNQFDGFFKGWLKQFFILLFVQIWVSLLLILGFTLDFWAGNTLSELIYFSILLIIAKSNAYSKGIFSQIYQYSHNKLKDFI